MKKEIRLGIMTILTVAISIWGYKYLKGQNVFSNVKTLKVKFDEVASLEVASPVAVRGFKVGSVIDFEIDPENVDNIVVTFDVEGDIPLSNSTVAVLTSAGVMGGRYIELQFDKLCNGSDCIQDGDFVNGSTSGMLASMVSNDELDGYVSKLGTGMDTILQKMTNLDEAHPINKTLMNLEKSMENLTSITERLDRLLTLSSKNITGSMENLNSISANMAMNNETITQTLGNIQQLTKNLNDADLGKTIKSADSAIGNASDAISELKTVVAGTKESVASLNEVLSKLGDGGGSIAKLLNDGSLYDNLSNTTKNLDLLMQDLRLNPSRYIKVSVFGKKKETDYILPKDDPAFQN